MDMMQRVLAKKYAQAFLNVRGHPLAPDTSAHSEQFVLFMRQRKKALFYVQLALLDDRLKKESLLKVLEQFKLDTLLEKLVDILIAHRRLFLLPEVVDFIVQISNEQLHKIDFKVESSHELTHEQLHELKKFLASQTGKQITLLPRIDTTLIAGIRLISTTFEWERSIRKQLRALSHIR
jgi:ATP synthase F1 delta subunit